MHDHSTIYVDHASSTVPFLEVIEATQQWLPVFYANPDAKHPLGAAIKKEIELARKQLAALFKVTPKEIIFTHSGTEAMNVAIKGVAMAAKKNGNHIITVATEHKCVLESVSWCQDVLGYETTVLPVNAHGEMDINELEAAITNQTVLIAIMAVNNETGVISPIEKIKTMLLTKYPRPTLIVDAVAALGKIDTNQILGDVTGFSSHKFGGLVGSGFLIIKEKVAFKPLLSGGQQEFGKLAGTPFAIGAITSALAAKLAINKQKEVQTHMQTCFDYFVDQIRKLGFIPLVSHNQSTYICSFLTQKLHAATMLNALAAKGIYASASAACSSESVMPSHVVMAMGYSKKQAETMIRFSFNHTITLNQLQTCVIALKEALIYAR